MDNSARFAGTSWRKSSLSENGACVEVAFAAGLIGVRDSKNGSDGPILVFGPAEWDAFVGAVANGEFKIDRLAG